MNMRPWVQMLKQVPLEYFVTARENYVNMSLPIATPVVKISISKTTKRCGLTDEDYLLTLMEIHFFCFNFKSKCKVAHRVYMNINTTSNKDIKSAADIFCYIIREIMYKINGVKLAKISVLDRIDTIIIYTSSIAVSNNVLEKIQEYQNNNGVSGFSPEIPMMTQAQIYGVATASEPPQVIMRKGQLQPAQRKQSFGSLRADLIYNAL